jgi:ketosteroid isomerase-like protein
MTNTNVTLLRDSVNTLWNHGDVDGFMRPFTEDAELNPEARFPDLGRTVHGRAQITEFMKAIHRPVVLGRVEESGDQVIYSFAWIPEGSTAADVDADASDWTLVYTFADGQIVRAQYFRQRADAIECAKAHASIAQA